MYMYWKTEFCSYLEELLLKELEVKGWEEFIIPSYEKKNLNQQAIPYRLHIGSKKKTTGIIVNCP